MDIAKRPLPRITEETRQYWARCANNELTLQHCLSCGGVQHYPRVVCKACLSSELELRPASGKGTVYSFTVIRRAPTPYFRDKVPYALALVRLDEGVMLMSNIVECDVANVAIDMMVELQFEDIGEGQNLPMFRPANPSHS